MGHAVVNHTVFIDECGYNIWTARSQRGERAYRQVCGQRGKNMTWHWQFHPLVVFHSAILGGMNGRRFDDFLAQTRLNLDPDEHMIFIYDGEPANRNSAIPGPSSELRKLPPYSPFLNIVEQDVSALKAAIKADTSRPEIQVQMNDRAEARRQGIALGNYRKQLLLQALQRNIGTITVAKCGQWFRFYAGLWNTAGFRSRTDLIFSLHKWFTWSYNHCDNLHVCWWYYSILHRRFYRRCNFWT